MMRGPRDKIRTIERKLGFFTENGLRRAHNADLHPSVRYMIGSMDEIKRQYAHLHVDELRTSEPFARAWQTVFDDIGPDMWPATSSFDVEPTVDPELYPRRLVYGDIYDRALLEENFLELLLQKCVLYQRNQVDKSRREARAREASEAEQSRSSVTYYEVPTPNMLRDHHSTPAPAPTPQISQQDEASNIQESDGTNSGIYSGPNSDDEVQILERNDDYLRRFNARRGRARSPTSDYHRTDMAAFYNHIHTTKRFRVSRERGYKIPRKRPCRRTEAVKADVKITNLGIERDEDFDLEQRSASDNSDAEDFRYPQRLLVKLKVPWHSGDKRWQALLTDEAGNASQPANPVGRRTPPGTIDSVARSSNIARGLEPMHPDPSRPAVSVQTSEALQGSEPSIKMTAAAGNESLPCGPDWNHEAPQANLAEREDSSPVQARLQADLLQTSRPLSQSQAVPADHCFKPALRPSNGDIGPIASSERKDTPLEKGHLPRDSTGLASIHRPMSNSTSPALTHDGPAPQLVQKASTPATVLPSNVDAQCNTPSGLTSRTESLGGRISEQKDAYQGERVGTRHGTIPFKPRTTEAIGYRMTPESRLEGKADSPVDAETSQTAPLYLSSESDERKGSGRNEQSQAMVKPSSSTMQEPVGNAQQSNSQLRDPLAGAASSASSTTQPSVFAASEGPQRADEVLRQAMMPTVADSNPVLSDSKLMTASELTCNPSPAVVASDSHPAPDRKDSEPQQAATDAQTSILILVEWKHKDETVTPTATRILRYTPQLWKALKADMPSGFVGKRLLSLVPGTVSMSAAEVMQQYGEGIGDAIADEALEECIEFLTDQAFGEDAGVQRTWRKATVTMRD